MGHQSLETEIDLPVRVVNGGAELDEGVHQLRFALHGEQAVGYEAQGLLEEGEALRQLGVLVGG
ncbi:MAG: hypothetical protein AB2693_18770 [Candidatus Thiodiazotropha sp.]